MRVDLLPDIVGVVRAEKRRPIRDDVEQRTHADKRIVLSGQMGAGARPGRS